MKPIKLLYITNGINGSGGLERVLSVKASYLAEKLNYELHILVLNNAHKNPFYQFSKLINYHSIEVSGNFINYFLQYKKGVKKTINAVQPDVISVCDDGLKGMLFPVFFGKKIPVIYERHASFKIFSRSENPIFLTKLKLKYFKKLVLWSSAKFDKFILLTSGNTKEWPLPNIQVIPNSLSFYPKEKSELRNKKIIAVGNHGYQKGFDRLLLIWQKVNQKFPEWILEIYGKKTKNSNLESLIKRYNLSESVKLKPPTKNIVDNYLESSIYVMTSRSEGFGMVLIEAMACGVPCIAFDCPSGPADIITDQEDGFLIENGNIEAFAKALSELMADKKKRMEMGKKAKKHVKRYHPDIIMKQWDQLFKDLL